LAVAEPGCNLWEEEENQIIKGKAGQTVMVGIYSSSAFLIIYLKE